MYLHCLRWEYLLVCPYVDVAACVVLTLPSLEDLPAVVVGHHWQWQWHLPAWRHMPIMSVITLRLVYALTYVSGNPSGLWTIVPLKMAILRAESSMSSFGCWHVHCPPCPIWSCQSQIDFYVSIRCEDEDGGGGWYRYRIMWLSTSSYVRTSD